MFGIFKEYGNSKKLNLAPHLFCGYLHLDFGWSVTLMELLVVFLVLLLVGVYFKIEILPLLVVSLTTIYPELLGVIWAVEIAVEKGWHGLWIESDSMLVGQAISNHHIIPWHLQSRWQNMLGLRNMRFHVSRIYRAGNRCAYKLASFGVRHRCTMRWDLIPNFTKSDF